MAKRETKKRTKKELPHNSRTIAAGLSFFIGRVVLWTALGALVVTNIGAIQTSTPLPAYDNINALLKAKSADSHIQLAQVYWQNKRMEDAVREIALAKELSSQQSGKPEDVLGSTTPSDILTSWEKGPQALRAQYDFWQGVIKEHPDYRDAFLTLAFLATQLNQSEDARYYQLKAEALDPNATSTKTK